MCEGLERLTPTKKKCAKFNCAFPKRGISGMVIVKFWDGGVPTGEKSLIVSRTVPREDEGPVQALRISQVVRPMTRETSVEVVKEV